MLEKTFRLVRNNPGLVLFIAVYSYTCFVLLNRENAWVIQERLGVKSVVLGNTRSFSQDLKESLFNWELFDPAPRVRPLSNLFLVLDTRVRSWLWNHVPPHPSLSLTFLFSLVLSPYFLLKLFRGMGLSRNEAFGLSSLYISSPGLLSLVCMYHRPAKPLVNFLFIYSIYLASRLSRPSDQPAPQSRLDGRFFLLIGAVFLSFFCDETALLIFLVVPLLFPRTLVPWPRSVLYLCLVPLVSFLYLVVFPFLTERLGYPRLNLLGYDMLRGFLDWSSRTEGRTFGLIGRSAILLFQDSLGLTDPLRGHRPAGQALAFANQSLLLLMGGLFLLGCLRKYRSLGPPFLRKAAFLALPALALLLLGLFHGYLMATFEMAPHGLYWYGAYFSVGFVFFMGTIAGFLRDFQIIPKPQILIPVTAGVLMANTLYVFPYTNYAWKRLQNYHSNNNLIMSGIFSNRVNRFALTKTTPSHLGELTKAYWRWKRSGSKDPFVPPRGSRWDVDPATKKWWGSGHEQDSFSELPMELRYLDIELRR